MKQYNKPNSIKAISNKIDKKFLCTTIIDNKTLLLEL